MLNQSLSNKLKNVELLITDVDGVLTDGKIIISSNGGESKMFCVEDGTGVALAKYSNLKLAFLSGRYSKSTEIRAKELGIKYCIQGFLNKKEKLIELCQEIKVEVDKVAYIGDGIVDIPVLEIVGCPISVPNAHRYAKDKSIYITQANGGEGVLYEVVELILNAKEKYQDTINIMKKKVF